VRAGDCGIVENKRKHCGWQNFQPILGHLIHCASWDRFRGDSV
jgi:hypothetical protein